MKETSNSMWSRALQADLRYATKVSQLAAVGLESLLLVLENSTPQFAVAKSASRQRHSPPTVSLPPRPSTVVLEGEGGSSAVGFFIVENTLGREISTPVQIAPLTAANGRQIETILRFQPGEITLEAGQQAVVRVKAHISRRLQ